MVREAVTVHEEHLCKLADFCRVLEESLRAVGLSAEQSLRAFQSAISAECVRCGISVNGDELYALSQPPAAERASMKTGRLRLGDCARQGCDAWHYRLAFQPHLQLDWPKLLAEVQLRRQHSPAPILHKARWLRWASLLRSRQVLRVGFGIALVMVLLFIRHWYQGGQIPLLREAEHFRVDPAPEEQASPHATGP